MKPVLRIFASGLLLSGCANGGAFVSAGTIDYGKLFAGLRCEVAEARSADDLGKFDKWSTLISTTIEGNFMRDVGAAGSLDGYGIGIPNQVTVKANAGRKVDDLGTADLAEGWTKVSDVKCDDPDIQRYDMSAIGLGPWYANVNKRVKDAKTAKLLIGVKFKREVTYTFVNGQIRFQLFRPVVFGPSFSALNTNKATITIKFEERRPAPLATVNLSEATLDALEDIFQNKPRRSGGGGRQKSSGTEILREIETDRLQDDLKLLRRELEEFQ